MKVIIWSKGGRFLSQEIKMSDLVTISFNFSSSSKYSKRLVHLINRIYLVFRIHTSLENATAVKLAVDPSLNCIFTTKSECND